MPWWLITFIGAPLNAIVNLGYKKYAGVNITLFVGIVSAVSAVVLIAHGLLAKSGKTAAVLSGPYPVIMLVMGLGSGLVWFLFVSALTKGPITLVDPLWACIYALVSGAIGMLLLRENPSMLALCGVGLYLAGAFLMARG